MPSIAVLRTMTTTADPSIALARTRRHWWWHYEVPTLLLATVLYAAWAALLWWHAALPGWALFLAGGFLAQLHFSLQHESIHAMRHLPKWLRHAVVWPPLNLWLPYPFYNRGHSSHHVNFHLTHPERDNESAYHSAPAWAGYGLVWRWIYMANQTIAFRVVLGPFLRLWKLVRFETAQVLSGNFSRLPTWLWHALSVAPVLYYVTAVCGMGFGEYLLYFVYPGMMLGSLRTFTEHRWADYAARARGHRRIESRVRAAVPLQQPAPRAPPRAHHALVRDTGVLPQASRGGARGERQLLLPGVWGDRAAVPVQAGVHACPPHLVARVQSAATKRVTCASTSASLRMRRCPQPCVATSRAPAIASRYASASAKRFTRSSRSWTINVGCAMRGPTAAGSSCGISTPSRDSNSRCIDRRVASLRPKVCAK